MKIEKVLFSPGKSAFFFDDQRAIKEGAEHDGFAYIGKPSTKGFRTIRKAGESISVMVMLENGHIAIGDCAAVQYSGAGGRDPLFLAEKYIPFLNESVRPLLEGRDITTFREMADVFETMKIKGKHLHTAIGYGLSQALLESVAKARQKLKCEVICEEYGLPVVAERIPIFGQSGDDRYTNADKMILKQVEVMPHGLINSIDEKLGYRGDKLRDYIRWLVRRIKKLKVHTDYSPRIHLDVYGTLGIIFDYNMDRVADFIASLENDAGGHELYIEGPVDMEEKPLEIECLAKIKQRLTEKGSRVKIVADEWCNTLEDIRDFTDAGACHMVQIKTPDLGGIQNIVESILYCKEKGMEAYQGGTCNETDLSARTCVHTAMAARPEMMLAKPGMGFDEGYMIVNNEMERIIELLKFKTGEN